MSVTSNIKQRMQLIKEQAHMKPEDVVGSVNSPGEKYAQDLVSKYLGIDISNVNPETFLDENGFITSDAFKSMAPDDSTVDDMLKGIQDVTELENLMDTDPLAGVNKILGTSIGNHGDNNKIITGIPSIDAIDVPRDSQLAELTERGVDSWFKDTLSTPSTYTDMAKTAGVFTGGLFGFIMGGIGGLIGGALTGAVTGGITGKGADIIGGNEKLSEYNPEEWASRFNTSNTIGPVSMAKDFSYDPGYSHLIKEDPPSSVTIDSLKTLEDYNLYNQMPDDTMLADDSFFSSTIYTKTNPKDIGAAIESSYDGKHDIFTSSIINQNNSYIDALSTLGGSEGLPGMMNEFTASLSTNFFSEIMDATKFKSGINQFIHEQTQTGDLFGNIVSHIKF